jgi:sporulation protein YlmC with PRC-barrel domain
MAVLDFHIGAKVHCTDGRCGKLVKVVVDAQTQQVTDLIVEKGFLLRIDRVLPISTVARVTADDLYLNISSDELANFTEYHEVTVKEPAPGGYRPSSGVNVGGNYAEPYVPMIRRRLREGISAGKTVIDNKTEVENLERVLGHIDHVIVDSETETISHLVVRRGLIPDYRVIPIEKVEEVGDDIFVSLTQEELKRLPVYEPSGEVDIQGAEQPLSTEGGGSPTLAPDEQEGDISARVSRALAADKRTSHAVIDAISDRGKIVLVGEVDSAATRNAAEEIARQAPGVHTVVNELMIVR